MPLSVISKTPSSLVEPNRFFSDRRSRSPSCRSPSKYSTVSTMCSRTLGPARAPSLVTWPTRNTGTPVSLAKRVNLADEPRIWVTLPGDEGASSVNMVWIESTMRKAALRPWASAKMLSTEFSQRSSTSPPRPNRSARSRIW